MNAAFADYLIPFPVLDEISWPQFLHHHGVDLSMSWALSRAGRVAAFALLTPRPLQRTRVALVGAVPDERGCGAAAKLLDVALTRANARRDQWVELEVFAQNGRATKLCWSRGFKPVCALYGYAASVNSEACRGYADVSVSKSDAVGWLEDLDAHDASELPWLTSGPAIAARHEVQAWRYGRAQLIFETVAGCDVSVLSLIDRDSDQQSAAHLLGALRAHYPQKALSAPPLQRKDGTAQAFEMAGWARRPYYQWLLRFPMCG